MIWVIRAVETPPTSQRSQIVNSGKIPMAANDAIMPVPMATAPRA